eukprot:145319_1
MASGSRKRSASQILEELPLKKQKTTDIKQTAHHNSFIIKSSLNRGHGWVHVFAKESNLQNGALHILAPTKSQNATFQIEQSDFTIGRYISNDLVLSSPSISRSHCTISENGILTDFSTCGTYVTYYDCCNQQKTEKLHKDSYQLMNGDLITLTLAMLCQQTGTINTKQLSYFFLNLNGYEIFHDAYAEMSDYSLNICLNETEPNIFQIKMNGNDRTFDKHKYEKQYVSDAIAHAMNVDRDVASIITEHYGTNVFDAILFEIIQSSKKNNCAEIAIEMYLIKSGVMGITGIRKVGNMLQKRRYLNSHIDALYTCRNENYYTAKKK